MSKKPQPKTLLTAIIVDFWGSCNETPEDQVKNLTERYEELLAPAKLDVYTPAGVSTYEMKEGTDLILFDYGGMLPGTSLPQDNSRRLIEWAENNPSSLCVVVSGMTWRNYIKYEMEDKGLNSLFNLVREWDFIDDEGDAPDGYPIPDWFRVLHELPYIDPYAKVATKFVDPTESVLRKTRKSQAK